MTISGTLTASAIAPTFIDVADGIRIAVRVTGPPGVDPESVEADGVDPDSVDPGSVDLDSVDPERARAAARPVLMVHGLGSNGWSNWERTGWVRALAGPHPRRLLLVDLRGHGDSGAPRNWAGVADRGALATLLDDLRIVLDTLAPGEPVDAVGYSLGARLLTELTAALPVGRIARVVVGGMADQPLLQHIDMAALGAAVRDGTGAAGMDLETARILHTISVLPGNDVAALSELVGLLQQDPATAHRPPPPTVPTLVAVGTQDPIFDRARWWAGSLPAGRFVEIPGRHHISAVPSRVFRDASVAFLS